ncbi:ComEC/Rec2 family competence protein [uncultured Prevotella sp.]|uniref:ComEC/Rec2 family competence protein n=1 Tax=uncultured Prevotella sp. TaxID=159272 RepID=UPI0025FD044F|nr:ComEC/Rec2 family competence protein [uncultured Prevotella sp.]
MKTNGQIQLYPVLRLALFLIAGIVLGELLYGVLSFKAWFAATVVSLLLTLLAWKHCILQSVMIFITCMLFGGSLVSVELDKAYMPVPDKDMAYSAVVISQPVVSGKVIRCDLMIADVSHPVKVKASIYRDERADKLRVGDGIKAVSLLEKPSGYADSDFDYGRYLLYHGYVATTFIYIDEWSKAVVDLTRLSLIQRTRIAALVFRDRLLRRYTDMGFSGQSYAVLAAMTLGDKSSLSDRLKEDYSVSGASHILALSGLHLGIIYAILSLIFLRRRWQIASQVLILLAIWTYVFIVGMSASVVRSAVMITVYSFVSLLNRNKMSLNTLAVAAVVILIVNPLYLYDVGFQMSFAAVFFIILFYRPVLNLMPGCVMGIPVIRQIWQMMSVSLAAQIGVAPLIAFYFGRFSCYFLLTNIIVVPAATIILYGAVLMAALSFVPYLQTLLSALLLKVVVLLNSGVSFVAELPGASIDGIAIGLLQLVLIYVAIFSFSVLVVYAKKMMW